MMKKYSISSMGRIIKNSVILIFIFLSGCYKEPTEIEVNQYSAKLVIECYLTNIKTIRVKVSSNVNTDSMPALKPIVDAQVSFFENDKLIGNATHDSSGYYSLNFIPSNNNFYKIIVKHNDYPTANAEVFIPEPLYFTVDTASYQPNYY
ncbi:MAG: hypothetical protein ACP5PS_06340, partial [Bacteroidales bacterium]